VNASPTCPLLAVVIAKNFFAERQVNVATVEKDCDAVQMADTETHYDVCMTPVMLRLEMRRRNVIGV